MILVTLGSSNFQFDRLLKILDNLCKKNVICSDDLIVQIGKSSYKPQNYKILDLLNRDEYEKYVHKCDIMICHAGTGSVVPALKMGKKIIVFPRLSKYGEHIDDHQLDLCKIFTEQKYVLCAKNEKELEECIKKIDKFHPKKFISNSENFTNNLIEYLEKM